MVKLTDRHRPRGFGDVLGQNDVVDWFRDQVRSRKGAGAIIHGPAGVGKTTLGRIYPKALFCRQPSADASPCGQCDDCVLFESVDGHPGYREVDCARHGRTEDIIEEVELLRFSSLLSPRRVLVLDEAHQITPRAFDILARPLEDPKSPATVLLLTTALERLPAPIVSRNNVHELRPVSFETSLQHLKRVCETENIAYDIEGLSLLADISRGGVRDLLMRLDQVSEHTRSVSAMDVRRLFSLDYVDIVVRYIRAVLDGDLQQQVSIIEAWSSIACNKSDAIQRLLVYLFTTEVMRLFRSDVLMGNIPSSDRQWIVDQMALRAAESKLSERQFWQETIDFWNPSSEVTESSLLGKAIKFDMFMNIDRRQPVSVEPPSKVLA